MTLQWSTISIPLGSSQDESQTPFTLPNPLLQVLQNARVYKTGSIGKRPGWDPEAALHTLERLVVVGDDVFTLAGRQIVSTTSAAIDLGSLNAKEQRVDYHAGPHGAYSLSEVEVIARTPVVRDITSEDGLSVAAMESANPDFAVSETDGIAVIAWEVGLPTNPSGAVAAQHVIFAVAVDMVTHEPVDGPRQISTVSAGKNQKTPHCVLSGPRAVTVVYSNGADNEIRGRTFDTSTRTWGADTVLANNLSATVPPRFDTTEVVGGAGWYLIYRNVTPVVQITRFAGLTATATTTLGEDASIGALTIYADAVGDRVWCAWYDGVNGVRACIRQASVPTTIVLATTTMEAASDVGRQLTWGVGVGTVMVLCWTTDGNITAGTLTYGRKLLKFRSLAVGGTKGTQTFIGDVELIGKAYTAPNGFIYVPVLYDGADSATTVQGLRSSANQVAFTLMLTDAAGAAAPDTFQSFRVAATWAIGEAGRKRSVSSLSSFRAVLVDATKSLTEQWFMLSPEFDLQLASLGANAGQIIGRPGVDLCRQRIDNFPPLFATKIGDAVVFSGGTPQVWDGSSLTEYGFLVPPENALGVDNGIAGAPPGLNAGSYSVQLVWEYRLANGDIVQSTPSLVRSAPTVSTIPMIAGHQMQVTFPSLCMTRKWLDASLGKGVMSRAYRTEGDQTIYYREGDFGTTSGFVPSIPAPLPLVMRIDLGDAVAILHGKIYTTDGILPNFPPPALAHIITHRNRLFGIVAEDRRKVVFTHEYEIGELPGWHPDLVIDVPDQAVALAALDEKLVIFCQSGVYVVAGNGPDRKGLNSDYDQPFRLNSPHGCTSAASVVSFPEGIFFLSELGFCLLDRKVNVQWVGGPVEDTTTAYPYAHASAVLDDRQWIYWSLTNHPRIGQSTAGRVVVYDWGHNVWSVDLVSYQSELGATATFVTSFARTKTDVLATVQSGANVFLHRAFADVNGAWIFTRAKTAKLNLGSNQLYHRARWLTLLGEKRGPHQLTVTVNTFHHASSAPSSQVFTWTDGQTSALISYALKMHLANQKGAMFEIEIADGPDVAFPFADDSAQFIGLQLEIGAKKRTPQVAQAATE